ncbi:PilW family protein [Thalassotalea crassostreae]|uniref:PilW family protein n=1 Tax=Thalassotalea crassostreae TaxID=1763536 RepID=UPI000838C56C|nr:type II secretion system protein [Thalassotalea crassostreae]
MIGLIKNNFRVPHYGPLSRKTSGFTLLELVLVIAILGIISVGFIGFINIGSNVYKNVSSRDLLISDARFAVERLNRELRNALPNSIRIIDNNGDTQCLEFVPVLVNSIYLEIPIFPITAGTVDIVQPSIDYTPTFNTKDRVVVYPISAHDAYDHANISKSVKLTTIDKDATTRWTINLAESDFSFEVESPNQRLFIVSQPVSYCVSAGELRRSEGYGYNPAPTIINGGVLMAEHIDLSEGYPFAFDAKLQSDAIVQVNLKFTQNNESVFFSNGVHITNVP